MRKSGNELTDRPKVNHGGTTDVLSDLLDTLRMATFIYGRFEVGAPWGFRLPDEQSARIIVVVRGAARVEVAGSRRPLALSAGDLAPLPHGGAATLRHAEGSGLHLLGDNECRQISAAEPVRFGSDGTQTTLIIAAFRFRATHRTQSIQRLARAIHIPAGDSATSPSLTSAMQMLATESATRAPGSAVIVNRLADILLVQAILASIARSGCPEHEFRPLPDSRTRKPHHLL